MILDVRLRFALAAAVALAGCGSSSSSSPDATGNDKDGAAPDGSAHDGGPTSTLPACDRPFGKSADVVLSTNATGSAAAVAWTGAGFGALWVGPSAQTTGGGTLTGYGGPLLFMALDATGKTTSAPGLVATNASSAALVPTSTGFEAFFVDSYVGPPDIPSNKQTAIALAPNGVPQGTPTVLVDDPEGVSAVSAASSDSTILAAWNGIGVLYREILGGSAPMDMGDVAGSSKFGAFSNAVWAGDRFAIAWRDIPLGSAKNTGVHLAELGRDGTPMGTALVLWEDLDTNKGYLTPSDIPSIVWTGTDYRVAWAYTTDVDTKLFTTTVPRGGPAGTPQSVDLDPGLTAMTSAPLWDGEKYGTLIGGKDSLSFVRIDPKAGAADGPPIVLGSGQGYGALIWTGREYATVWPEKDRVVFARIGSCP